MSIFDHDLTTANLDAAATRIASRIEQVEVINQEQNTLETVTGLAADPIALFLPTFSEIDELKIRRRAVGVGSTPFECRRYNPVEHSWDGTGATPRPPDPS